MHGNLYPVENFNIPQIKLGSWEINHATLSEEIYEYQLSAFLMDLSIEEKMQLLEEEKKIMKGKIGWSIFCRFCSFFDFPHNQIVLGQSIESLIQTGYTFEDFIPIPFDLEKFGIILSISTDLGPRRFILDTGTNRSLIRKDLLLT